MLIDKSAGLLAQPANTEAACQRLALNSLIIPNSQSAPLPTDTNKQTTQTATHLILRHVSQGVRADVRGPHTPTTLQQQVGVSRGVTRTHLRVCVCEREKRGVRQNWGQPKSRKVGLCIIA